MALCLISQFNRASMSVAGTSRIMADYGLAPTRMGTVYSAFLLLYSICMIPGGLFIDRFGPRRALMVVGFGSALFAALTGVVGWVFAEGSSLWLALVLVRGTMGLVSAPLHPAGARAVGNWFSLRQRSLANGIVTGAAIAGVALTYRGFGALIQSIGWQAGFVASAAVTAVLTALWAWYATDHPGQHPSVNAAERGLVESWEPDAAGSGGPAAAQPHAAPRPWLQLLTNRSLLLVTLSYAAVGYLQYVFVYWMQYYFEKVLQLGATTSQFYASIPQVAMAVTMPIGGGLADRLGRRWGVRRGRALVSASGMIASAGLLGLGVLAKDPVWIVVWFTLTFGALGTSEGPFWATAVDIGGRAGGAAAAICNTGGNLGGLLAPVVTPWVSAHYGWPWGISLGGLLCLLGALCWCGIDPRPASDNTRACV